MASCVTDCSADIYLLGAGIFMPAQNSTTEFTEKTENAA
jgi:hypothetical protein